MLFTLTQLPRFKNSVIDIAIEAAWNRGLTRFSTVSLAAVSKGLWPNSLYGDFLFASRTGN